MPPRPRTNPSWNRRQNTLYRGILMPLSSDGESIDFIYGVINWKEMAEADIAAGIEGEALRAIADAPEPMLVQAADGPAWADGPNSDFVEANVTGDLSAPPDTATLSLWPDDGLADRLS